MAETRRYLATSRYAYALALVALVELARDHAGPSFEFGPLTLSSLEGQGLTVAGDDLTAVTRELEKSPGLVHMPDW